MIKIDPLKTALPLAPIKKRRTKESINFRLKWSPRDNSTLDMFTPPCSYVQCILSSLDIIIFSINLHILLREGLFIIIRMLYRTVIGHSGPDHRAAQENDLI